MSSSSSPSPISLGLSTLYPHLESLCRRECFSRDEFLLAAQSLRGICRKLLDFPADPKFRTVNTLNPQFHQKIGRFPSAIAALKAIGFGESLSQEEKGKLHISKVAEDIQIITDAIDAIDGYVRQIEGEKSDEMMAIATGGESRDAAMVVEDDGTILVGTAMADEDEENLKRGEGIGEDSDVYVVESLIDHRVSSEGNSEYLVKWRGYPHEDNTWEGEDNILDRGLIAQFHEEKRAKESARERELFGDLSVSPASYDISEVRVELMKIKDAVMALPGEQIERIAVNSQSNEIPPPIDSSDRLHHLSIVLSLLIRIISNIEFLSENPKFGALNFSNEKLRRFLRPLDGAIGILKFIGFRPDDTENLKFSLPLSSLPTDFSQKVSRCLSIIRRFSSENSVDSEVVEIKKLGPVERDVKSFHFTADKTKGNSRESKMDSVHVPSSSPSSSLSSSLPSKSLRLSDDSLVPGDRSLILAAMAAERRQTQQNEFFRSKTQQTEIKESLRRKYSKTLMKIIFPSLGIAFSAFFRPSEKVSEVFSVVNGLFKRPFSSPFPFALQSPPNLRIEGNSKDLEKTLKTLQLVPAATLIVNFNGNPPLSADEIFEEKLISQRKPFDEMHLIPIPTAENSEEIAKAAKANDEKLRMALQVKDKMQRGGKGAEEDEEADIEEEINRRERQKTSQLNKGKPTGTGQGNTPSWMKKGK